MAQHCAGQGLLRLDQRRAAEQALPPHRPENRRCGGGVWRECVYFVLYNLLILFRVFLIVFFMQVRSSFTNAHVLCLLLLLIVFVLYFFFFFHLSQDG